MRIKVTVCPKEDLGPLSPNEERGYETIAKWFEEHTLPAQKDMLNTSVRGWSTVAHWGATAILHCDILRGVLGRFQGVAYPWVPPGEMWPKAIGTDSFHTSWRLDFRATNPLPEIPESVQSGGADCFDWSGFNRMEKERADG